MPPSIDSITYNPAVHLGPSSSLDASGTVTYAIDAAGYHKSDVLDGGTILVDGTSSLKASPPRKRGPR